MADRKRRTARVTAVLLAAGIMLALLLSAFSAWRGRCRQVNGAAENRQTPAAVVFFLRGQANADDRAAILSADGK